jgi:hypothetical protein
MEEKRMEHPRTEPSKKAYRPPNLLVYGGLIDLTLKVASTNSDNAKMNNHMT